ncbi:hypothetical protein EMIHUDRAFT_114918 [Emiliania huxleyi CCMP1516]|uniref:MATH domain-containing protein n=2 Tax=Emiliania huxleyi TaxID=2903 RepID=A0A0D3JTM7_EMIH1|nr:hypothetical protein EMIHUDRAFT_114918 [Emiliania huxleyi CCMP1516]EOD26862.1 hypothetical protein EMIHUDRAFT_114918 [Emiliania huxleyi CCMP1516]|eukprot:XP_005779291.1 hypothetical protein EMIHUDRAFT_114918 [Emiliania huxleyi CCMP1516]
MAASDPGTHAPTILECLGSEELMRLVTDLVENGDALCAALACTAMRDAIWARAPRAEEAEYTWHVNMYDVALRDTVYSPIFKSGQCRWRLLLDAAKSDDASHLFSALKPNLGYPKLVTVAELCEAGSGYVADGKLVVSVKVRAQAARPPFLWRPRLCTPLRDCLSSPARLRWCIETFPVLRPLMCETAAAVGDLHLFKMLRCLTDDAYLMPWDEGTARAAARAGHHELLKLARGVGCPWEEEHMLEYAAESGSVEMATWLHEEGIRWSGKEPGIAAACGHLHFLQWALEAGGAAWDADMYTWPAATGQLDVLRWLNADLDLLSGDSGPRGWRFKVCLYAAAGGQLEVLRWATTVGSEDDPVGPLTAFIVAETLEVAAANGRRTQAFANLVDDPMSSSQMSVIDNPTPRPHDTVKRNRSSNANAALDCGGGSGGGPSEAEHSIGVAHLAGTLLKHLRVQQPEDWRALALTQVDTHGGGGGGGPGGGGGGGGGGEGDAEGGGGDGEADGGSGDGDADGGGGDGEADGGGGDGEADGGGGDGEADGGGGEGEADGGGGDGEADGGGGDGDIEGGGGDGSRGPGNDDSTPGDVLRGGDTRAPI